MGGFLIVRVGHPMGAGDRHGWRRSGHIRFKALEPNLPSGVLRRTPRLGPSSSAAGPRSLRRTALLAPLLIACGGAAPEPGPAPTPPGETCPIPVAVTTPTFSGDVLPMLRSTCGAGSASTCHGTPSPVGKISYAPSLTAAEVRAQLVGVDPSSAPTGAGWKRVAAGDVTRSWLIEKITSDDPGGTGRAFGNRMPLGLPNLCAPTVQTVKAWIARGALDD